MNTGAKLIQTNLLIILAEIRIQRDIGKPFLPDLQGFTEQVAQVREWLEDTNEYGIAYETVVSMLEEFPFRLSGSTAVKLLEVGLLLQFKTERPSDAQFDSRQAT
ncbi:hypothetical protein [Methyloversatilis sp.]|uniref:hypothetical protein n=1 Tax=Methyloversatilis sp. TaxID=2569862 RepID=UPI0035B41E89